MRRILTAVLTLGLAATLGCGDKQATPSTPTEPAIAEQPTETAGAQVVAIVPASLTVQGDPGDPEQSVSLSITETGDIEVGDDTVGKVTADGRLLDRDGNVLLTLAEDGTVTTEGGTESVVVREDGTIEKDGQVLWSIAEDGTIGGVLMAEAPAGITATYSGDPAGRRAASLVWLGTMLAKPVAEPAPGEVETAPAPEAAPPGE